jgi:hypothetical protein
MMKRCRAWLKKRAVAPAPLKKKNTKESKWGTKSTDPDTKPNILDIEKGK